MNNVTRYPLCWPAGRPRTEWSRRAKARFHTQTKRQGPFGIVTERSGVSLAEARDLLG